MPLTPITLGIRSNPGQTGAISAARLINAYAQDVGEEGKIRFPIIACDGFESWSSTFAAITGSGNIRGGFVLSDSAMYVASGTRIIKLNTSGAPTAIAAKTATITVTIASPAVFSWTGHGLKAGAAFVPTTTGALPTGLTAGTTYYVISTGLTADSFRVSATPGGSAVNTSGTQSGTHTGTAGAGTISSSGLVTMARNRKETTPQIGIVTSDGKFYILENDTLVDYSGLITSLSTDRTATVTITIASPGVVTWTEHRLLADAPVSFSTTGTLPTGIVAGTVYYVASAGLTSDSFRISATRGGPAIITSGSQAGTHTGTAVGAGSGTLLSITAIDGYFVLLFDNGEFFASSIDEGGEIDSLEFAKAESNPDGGVRGLTRGRDVVLAGERSTEFWQNTGATDFPFERVTSADYGCYAAASMVNVTLAKPGGEVADTICMAATDAKGAYIGVVMLSGYSAVKISDSAVDRSIVNETDKTTIRGFARSENGRTFYTIRGSTFTWAFDFSTGFWHERTSDGLSFWRIWDAFTFNGMSIVADYTLAKLYKSLPTLYAAAADSVLTLKHSNNNGNTWLVTRTTKTLSGSTNLTQRIKFNRLGQSKEDGKVFNIAISNAVMEDGTGNSITVQPPAVHAWPNRMRFFRIHIDTIPGGSRTSTPKGITGLAVDAKQLRS